MAKRAPRNSAGRSRRHCRLRYWVFGVLGLGVAGLAAYVAWLDHAVRETFEERRWSEAASVYARPLELYAGRAVTSAQLEAELAAADYREADDARRPGTWSRRGNVYHLNTRAFDHWDGSEPRRSLQVELEDGRVSAIRTHPGGEAVDLVRLDPARIGRIHPGHHEDRLLVRLDDVPPTLIGALLAVEDRNFHRHHGVSPTAIARAAWTNVRAGRIVQGGSTLTQQLVKNLYLTSDRTFARKATEAVMAVLLELRYDKREILQAHVNEVYLAQDGNRAIHGFALGARHFYGEPLDALSVEQQALLVGMIRGPSRYHPLRNPERARQRRDLVLRLMAEGGVVDAHEAEAARGRPLGVVTAGRSRRHQEYPAFLGLVHRHLERDYRRADLHSEGLRIFTTMAPLTQDAAEAAVRSTLARWPGDLEAAVLMADADSGEVTAVVGGRDPRFDGFNRALDARRPVGSLIKPAIYLAALERPDQYGLATRLQDRPMTLAEGGDRWQPRNFDREFRGDVLLVDALAQSINVPAIRLGLDMGVPTVTDTSRRLGLDAPRRTVPSYLLGVAEHSPLEVAQMYQVLATGGFRTPLRSVRAVTDRDGEPLNRYGLSTETVFDAEPVYLVNTALQKAMAEGTGEPAYTRLPRRLELAGKTGTTNDTRDSWFAGFSGSTLGVVWVGKDDNTRTGLTGSAGALQVWTETLAPLGPTPFRPARPSGVEMAWVDDHSGRRSARGCANAIELPFVAGHEPDEWTECGRRRGPREEGGVGEWFRGLFN